MKTTLQDIKTQYAKEQGYEDWENLQFVTLSEGEEMEDHMNEICIRAQKAALEKAAESGCNSLELYNSEYEILSKSITKPENLIR